MGDIDTKGILGDDFLVDHQANLAVWKQEFSLVGNEIPIFKRNMCLSVVVWQFQRLW